MKTNTFQNVDKYISKCRQIHFMNKKAEPISRRVLPNSICPHTAHLFLLSISKSEQIYFKIQTNTFQKPRQIHFVNKK